MRLGKNFYEVALSVDRYIEANPFFRLLGIFGAVVGVAAACFTFYQIVIDLSDRRDERIIRSWDHLLKPVGGNTGKADAIEILFGYDISIDNIVIPCPAKNKDGGCGWRVVLEGLFDQEVLPLRELSRDGWQDTVFGYGVISEATVSHVDFKNANLSRWVLESLTANDTHWKNVNLHASHIGGDFKNAFFEAADLSSIFFHGNMTKAQFLLSNLSDASFTLGDQTDEVIPAQLPDFSMSWFWADQPPRISFNDEEIDLEKLNIGFVCDFGGEPQNLNNETPASENLLTASLEAGSGAWEIDCNDPISLQEAMKRYPKRYGAKQNECRGDDEGRSDWNRSEDVSKNIGC